MLKTMCLLALMAVSFGTALCGTYYVDSIEYLSAATSDGGFIQTEGDGVTLRYGFNKLIESGSSNGFLAVNAYPSVQSVLRWRVHWVGTPTEPVPSTIDAKVAMYGHSDVNVWIYGSYGIPGQFSGTSQLTDALANQYAHLALPNPATTYSAADGTFVDSHLGYMTLGASFTSTGPGTADGVVDYAVNGLVSLDARFQPNSLYPGKTTAAVDTLFRLRIIKLDTQTVASDLP